MRITQLMEKYKFLFLVTFIVMSLSLMYYGVGLLDSTIISLVFSVIAITIKYYGDKLFSKIKNKCFSNSKQ